MEPSAPPHSWLIVWKPIDDRNKKLAKMPIPNKHLSSNGSAECELALSSLPIYY